MKRIICFSLFLLLISSSLPISFAQEVKSATLEIPVNGASYKLAPVADFGVVAFSILQRENKKKENYWKFIRYDDNFSFVWEVHYKVSPEYRYITHAFNEDALFVVFYYGKKRKIRFLKIQLDEGDFKIHDVESYSKLEIKEVVAVNNNFFIKGSLLSSNALIHTSMSSKKLKVLATSFRGTPLIEQLKVDEYNRTLDVSFLYRSHFSSVVNVKTYDFSGKQLEEYRVEPTGEQRLLNGTLKKFSNKEIYITGTFSSDKEEHKTGLYIARFIGREQQWVRFYSFSKMKDLKKSNDKDSTTTKVRYGEEKVVTGVGNLIKTNAGLVYVSECMTPIYKRASTTSIDATGIPVTKYFDVFVGWRLQSGVLSEIDFSGELMSLVKFELETYDFKNPTQLIHINQMGNFYKIHYPNKGMFETIVKNKDDVYEISSTDLEFGTIKTNKQFSDKGIMFWFDQSFLMWKYTQKYTGENQSLIKAYRCTKIDLDKLY